MPGRRNLFSSLKYKAQTAMSRFLYEERGSGYGSGVYMEDEPPYEAEEKPRRSRRAAQQPVEEAPAEQAWQAPYQGVYQQPVYNQQPQQPQVQQQPQPITQFAAQIEEQRNRTRQENPNMVPFPGAYTGEQAPEQPLPAQMGICVLNMRNNADCRLAISMLRKGNALMVTMENVGDAAEMRRYVDTLSGACFSLNATITKVSRNGVYLLAPGAMAVMADAATSQMNSGAQRRPQTAQQRPQTRPAAYPQPAAYAPSYQNPTDENGFEYRAPAPEPQQAFYYQQPIQAPATPAFESQQPGTGYVPDRMEAVN